MAPGEERWGIFGVREADLHLLPNDLAGLDAIELGCGTAYVSAWRLASLAECLGTVKPNAGLHDVAAQLQQGE
jgi:hypothetical protein